ncbi:hypothetical protein GOP47_0009868 [Adiantum capillus-veneris]|uniref:Pentatricopeptide repeat-containing protein n=1 Tax=Adiantum capillus-veneris TaxID=13818 RepID=A0A9D4UYK0_ADICA|nr:hypothetical protein GOP47_0009868 [Adiantum capillus-veneris]
MIVQDKASIDSHKLKLSIDLVGHQDDFQNLSSLVQKCSAVKDLSGGKRLHAHLVKRGLHKNLLLGNRLLQMYLSCGSFRDVVDCFLSMHQRNGFSWNFLITAHARDAQHDQAVCDFQRMQCEGFLPNEHIFASVLSACTDKAAILNGKRVHTQLMESESQFSVAVLNALVNMYSKCSFLTDARRLFDQVLDRNVVSWTSIISAYSQHGQGEDAFILYLQMHQEGVLPNRVTFSSMLDACVTPDSLIEGKRLHAYIVGCELQSELVLASGLVTMYGNCGSLKDAYEVFMCLNERNTILWTSMIWGCIKLEQPDRALQLYGRMLSEGGLPDAITYSSVLDGCASQEGLVIGKHVHAASVTSALPFDSAAMTSLLNMYGRNGIPEEARLIFDKMKTRTTLSWTYMIASYVQCGESKAAIQLFMQMQTDGLHPDKVTLWRVVEACRNEAAIHEGKWVHGIIIEDSLESDTALATALVSMYGKFENLGDAQYIFCSMKDRNTVSWTAMITGYIHCDADKEALLLYDQMQQEGVIPNRVTAVCILSACANESHVTKGRRLHVYIANSDFFHDVVVTTALLSMYGKCDRLDDARRVFDEMNVRNVISWNAMLAAYTYCGCNDGVLELFDQMLFQGVIPNKVSFFSLLDACASQANLSRGNFIHSLAVKSGYDLDLDISNVILNMYGKCGKLKDAREVFKQMRLLDIVSWNTMICLWAQHGHSKTVFLSLEEMLVKGYLPDGITHSAVLYVCGHAGLISEGVHYFISFVKDHNVTPTADLWHCMIYMFARSGLMQMGQTFLEKLPVQPSSITWTSFCNASEGHSDIDRGEYIIKRIIELDEENASPYVMLSNMYATGKSGSDCVSDSSYVDEFVCQAVGSC